MAGEGRDIPPPAGGFHLVRGRIPATGVVPDVSSLLCRMAVKHDRGTSYTAGKSRVKWQGGKRVLMPPGEREHILAFSFKSTMRVLFL